MNGYKAVSFLALSFLGGCMDEAALPRAGQWSYRIEAVRQNTCGELESLQQSREFRLELESTRTNAENAENVVIALGHPASSLACTLTDQTLACPLQLHSKTAEDTSAIVEVFAAVHGDFSSSTHLEAGLQYYVSCTGPGCEGLAAAQNLQFPCQFTADISARSAQSVGIRTAGQ